MRHEIFEKQLKLKFIYFAAKNLLCSMLLVMFISALVQFVWTTLVNNVNNSPRRGSHSHSGSEWHFVILCLWYAFQVLAMFSAPFVCRLLCDLLKILSNISNCARQFFTCTHALRCRYDCRFMISLAQLSPHQPI